MKLTEYIKGNYWQESGTRFGVLKGRAFIDAWDAEFGLKPIEV